MKVKICGITDAITGMAAVQYGADAIGLVFAESKRKVSIEKAREIVHGLPKDVYKVGVFVNEPKGEIERIASIVGLTHIQLHGDETADFCRSLSLPVIKAISFQDNDSLKICTNLPSEFILLDSPKGKYRGGNGTTFNWEEVDLKLVGHKKVILAGGLNNENVEQAIKIMKPYMVDVSSGVETKEIKDLTKIKSFIEKVKGSKKGGKPIEHIYITE